MAAMTATQRQEQRIVNIEMLFEEMTDEEFIQAKDEILDLNFHLRGLWVRAEKLKRMVEDIQQEGKPCHLRLVK